MKTLWPLSLFVLISFAVGCGGGNTTSPPPPPPTVNAHVTISNTATIPLNLAMSTSFQPAEWDSQFFTINPSANITLGSLLPQHIRLQGISQGVPQGAAGSASTAWNFSILDAITQPVLGVGDHSPEFQIAKAPPFMYSGNNSGNDFTDTSFNPFAGYAQNLVSYYNKGGFSANGLTYVSPSYPNDTFTWWGIYNEPNINNGLTPQQYLTMYNTVVPAMQSIDPSLKFAALELADFQGQPQGWLPPFVDVNSGVSAQVDAIATHFYSSCNQADDDATVFASIATGSNFNFVSDVRYILSEMATNPALASVPLWITENNVNADFSDANGNSTCHPNQKFVTDRRGSSAFFAAWRPYVFSQFAKVGVQALYHWDFDADAQYGEVDYSTGNLQLSYWVDYWLARNFPASNGANILSFTNDNDTDIEVLAANNPDGSVVIMLANHALNAITDNNGPGAPRTINLDISALGTFSSGSLLVIDAGTSVTSGPVAVSVTPNSKMTISFNGYGVAFLTLK
jgi:uncharacterized protein YgiB involved in biofilm formation